MRFIRHGQSEFNVVFDRTGRDPGIPDAPLSPLGFRQAEVAAKGLKGQGVTSIISSPYTRALQTATTIAGVLGVGVRAEPLASERRLYSCDIGTPASLLRQEWPQADFSALAEERWWLPAKESHNDLMRRIEAFSVKWGWQDGADGFLVVSHWYFIHGITGCGAGNAEVVRGKI
ncbi:MAG: phosphoglycerate mutase family protein [Alphaproteobacteria bacterium]|nr:phosphoglycerate mutase family protein [Alphaproteobacteria bacterium]